MVAHLRSMGDDLSVSINDQLRSLMRKGTGIDAKKSLFSFGGLAGIAGQAAQAAQAELAPRPPPRTHRPGPRAPLPRSLSPFLPLSLLSPSLPPSLPLSLLRACLARCRPACCAPGATVAPRRKPPQALQASDAGQLARGGSRPKRLAPQGPKLEPACPKILAARRVAPSPAGEVFAAAPEHRIDAVSQLIGELWADKIVDDAAKDKVRCFTPCRVVSPPVPHPL